MIHRAIRVHGWTVDFLFAHRRNDPDGVLAVLRSYGAPASLVEQADDLMNAGPNCGFTFSNSDRRLCLTWVDRRRFPQMPMSRWRKPRTPGSTRTRRRSPTWSATSPSRFPICSAFFPATIAGKEKMINFVAGTRPSFQFACEPFRDGFLGGFYHRFQSD